jgi:hypothetical protein
MNSSFERPRPIPLYLHIPKCGGSTITNVLYQQCRSKIRDTHKTRYWHRGVYFYPAGLFSTSAPLNPDVTTMLTRSDLTAVAGHFYFGIHRHLMQPSLYVTVLRNPVSRILSLYDELKAQKRVSTRLEEFVISPPFQGIDNDQTRRIAGFDPSVQEDGSRMLEAAKINLKTHFGVVGLTERIDEALCLMHHVFGWQKYKHYYPRNITLNRTPADSVSPDLKQRIAEQNSLDVQLYHFAGEILDEAVRKRGADFQAELAKYKQSIKDLIEEADLKSMDTAERKQVHQLVLDMIHRGNTR